MRSLRNLAYETVMAILRLLHGLVWFAITVFALAAAMVLAGVLTNLLV